MKIPKQKKRKEKERKEICIKHTSYPCCHQQQERIFSHFQTRSNQVQCTIPITRQFFVVMQTHHRSTLDRCHCQIAWALNVGSIAYIPPSTIPRWSRVVCRAHNLDLPKTFRY